MWLSIEMAGLLGRAMSYAAGGAIVLTVLVGTYVSARGPSSSPPAVSLGGALMLISQLQALKSQVLYAAPPALVRFGQSFAWASGHINFPLLVGQEGDIMETLNEVLRNSSCAYGER